MIACRGECPRHRSGAAGGAGLGHGEVLAVPPQRDLNVVPGRCGVLALPAWVDALGGHARRAKRDDHPPARARVRGQAAGSEKAGFAGSPSVQASRSSFRLAWLADTLSPALSLRTGPFAWFHHGWKT